MESSQIKGLFVIVVAAVFAVYLGVAAATESFEAIAWVGGFAALAVILALGRNIWTLIPLGLALQGTINALPGSPPAWALAMVVTLAMLIVRFAMRKRDFVFRFDLLDAAVLLQALVIGQAYARNPSGLMMFGGALAGGKSYFVFAAAIVSYFCIAIVKPDAKIFRWVIIAMIVIMIGDGMIATIADRSAGFASLILRFYSNVNFDVARAGDSSVDLDFSRGGGGFALLGRAMVLPCFCLVRPIKCLSPFRPVIFTIVAVGSILVLLSGFRSGVAYLFVVFVISAIVRRKIIDVITIGLIGIFGLIILLMSGQVRALPYGVQRVLSVLPIEVSAAARNDAESSTRWRMEMWKLALTTDRYIHNKILGDGFGFSAVEMRVILDAAEGYTTEMSDSQDQMLAKGSYHGFHVETIRFTGIAGLFAALFLMGVSFRKALRLLHYYRGDSFFPYVVYVCMPFLIYPFWSMLVFGSYRSEFPQVIAMTGLLKMLDNLRYSESEFSKTESQVTTVPVRKSAFPTPAFARRSRGRA